MPRAGLLALALTVAGPLSGAPVSAAAPAETPAAVAAAGPAASPERVVAVRHDFGRRTMGQLPANLGRSLIGVWSADNLPPFLAGGVAAGAASFLDEPTQEAAVGQINYNLNKFTQFTLEYIWARDSWFNVDNKMTSHQFALGTVFFW